MDLEWWGALLFALVCALLGITGTALVLLLRETWWRAPHRIVERGRRRRQAQADWDVATEAAVSLTRPEPVEGPATGRAGLDVPAPGAGDETVILPQYVGADAGEEYAEGWNQPAPEPGTEAGDSAVDPAVGNPIYNEALRALRDTGEATAIVQAVTIEPSTVDAGEPDLADAYDVFPADDDPEQPGPEQQEDQDDRDRDAGNGGSGSAGRELEVQTAALPVVPRYPWPETLRPAAGWVRPHPGLAQPGLAWPRFGPLMRIARWAATRGRLILFRPIEVRRLVETWRSGELARLTGVQVRSGPIVRHRRGGGYWPVSA